MDATAEDLRRRARDLEDFRFLEDDLRAFPLWAFLWAFLWALLCFLRVFVLAFVFLALRAVDLRRRVVLRFAADLRFVADFFLFNMVFSPK